MPSPTTAGVLGIARTTGLSVPSRDSMRSVEMPARMEISNVSRRNPALRRVARTTGASAGLTQIRMRSDVGTRC